MGWNIFGGIGQTLSNAYHATEKGLYDLTRGAETAGYEVGTAIKTGHFIPLSQAYKQVGQVHENVPLLGNVSGRQFARIGASYGTQALPIVGTFGHLASHPNENVFQKASDIAFGIADVLPFAGDALIAFKKPIETGLNEVADAIRNGLRETSLPQLPVRRIGDYLPPNFWQRVEHTEPRFPVRLPVIRLPHIDIFPNDLPKIARTLTKDENAVVKGAYDLGNGIKRVIIEDLRTHFLDLNTVTGKIDHYVLDDFGNLIKVGEHTEGDITKILGGRLAKIANFLRSGKLLGTLAGLGIGLSVAGGLVSQGSSGSSSSGSSSGTASSSQATSSANVGGLGSVNVVCGQGSVNGYPAVITVDGVTYYAYGTTPADAEQGAGIQYVAEGQAPLGTLGTPFPSDPNKIYFVNSDGSVQTYGLDVGQQIIATAQQQCSGVVTQGQMNAGSVLQSQLQTLSASMPSTTPESQSAGQAVFASVAPEPSVTETTPVESQPTGQPSIFSNKTLWIGVAVVMIIIIIAMVV